ncbi:LacI family DNA-binding transcriptional regulator [Gynuella sunshinyii]|uniref:Transcriptional regulator n=1 Tax=Gynuella sunshinyii YC6258 TaxID=1445510 RepID=A0A0C5VYM2_9GAMM|nr:LacI family DNA-binding transcriptional regulator [Gynuella sunshinyii]AJQ95504.1 transcriptional regulator [Gynuella sunshinyii YC6258]
MRPTSAQVAKLAGVSRTTVSFVLNNVEKSGISNATREKVLAAAAQLGYEPNAAAQSLASGSSATIGLVLPDIHHLYVDSFLSRVVASVSEEVRRHDMKLLIETVDRGDTFGYQRLAKNGRIDGMIVVNPRENEYTVLAEINRDFMPLVAFGSRRRSQQTCAEFSTTSSDNFFNARLAVKHLIALGHKNIGHISFSSDSFTSVNSRERGWLAALEEHNLNARDIRESADLSAESGYHACLRLLSKKQSFSAIFAGNDTVAFGIIRALIDKGYRVPEDIAIVGYDDIPLAAYGAVPLTTIKTFPEEHGRMAVKTLLEHLKGISEPNHQKFDSHLVIRESCGARK